MPTKITSLKDLIASGNDDTIPKTENGVKTQGGRDFLALVENIRPDFADEIRVLEQTADDEGNPLRRLEKEPLDQYRMFLAYVCLPMGTRRFKVLSEITNLSESWLKNISGRYRWTQRTANYEQLRMSEIVASQEKDLNLIQSIVTTNGLLDYVKARELWLVLLEKFIENPNIAPKDLAELMRARQVIDSIGRNSARMPRDYEAGEAYFDRKAAEPKQLSFSGAGINSKNDDFEDEEEPPKPAKPALPYPDIKIRPAIPSDRKTDAEIQAMKEKAKAKKNADSSDSSTPS